MASSAIYFEITADKLRAGIQEDTTKSKVDLAFLLPRMTAIQFTSGIILEPFVSTDGSLDAPLLFTGTQADANLFYGNGFSLTQTTQQFQMIDSGSATLYDTQRATYATLALPEGFSIANITDGSIGIYSNVIALDQFATTHVESMSFTAFKTANIHSVGVFGNNGETYSCGVDGDLSKYGSGAISGGKVEFQVNSMFTDNTEIIITRTDDADTEFTVRKVIS